MTPLKTTALIYDFDGTLAPGNLPEHSLFDALGITDAGAFWSENRKLTEQRDADEVLTYMERILAAARNTDYPLTRDVLRAHGEKTPFFDGVDGWFDRINAYGRELGFHIEHYVISSGLLELIEGCKHFDRFQKVFACAYAYDEAGRAVWAAVAVNYTNKTQFLFRINKGIMNTWDNSAINRWQPKHERPVPFERMIFLGDGDTDIPSMKMVRYQGGQAVAVFDPNKWADKTKTGGALQHLIAEDRVHYVAPADFTEGSLLDAIVRGILGRMAQRPEGPGRHP